MFYLLSIMLLLVTSKICLGDDATKATFQRAESLGDKVCPLNRRLFEAEARSLASCVAMATKRVECLGVSYRNVNKTCYGCDAFADSAAQFEPLPGAVFYQRLTAFPEGYISISGHILNFTDTPKLAYDAASGACAESGGTLVKIDTPEMNTAIQSFLKNPENVYTGVDFWIQLRKAITGVWQFADGTSPADLDSKWAEGEPNGSHLCHDCGHLYADGGFMWADYTCTSPMGYICELV